MLAAIVSTITCFESLLEHVHNLINERWFDYPPLGGGEDIDIVGTFGI